MPRKIILTMNIYTVYTMKAAQAGWQVDLDIKGLYIVIFPFLGSLETFPSHFSLSLCLSSLVSFPLSLTFSSLFFSFSSSSLSSSLSLSRSREGERERELSLILLRLPTNNSTYLKIMRSTFSGWGCVLASFTVSLCQALLVAFLGCKLWVAMVMILNGWFRSARNPHVSFSE